MTEVALPDISNLSFERFSKIKSILQSQGPDSHPTIKPRSRSTTSSTTSTSRRTATSTSSSSSSRSKQQGNTTPAEKQKLAHHILSSSLSIIDSWKGVPLDNKQSTTSSSRNIIYEAASLAISTLYELRDEKSRKHLDTEKRHLSFILKLLDVPMIDESILELQTLTQSIHTAFHPPNKKLKKTNNNNNHSLESILTLSPNTNSDTEAPTLNESSANLVILTQIALLKALSKFPTKRTKPLSSKV